MADVTIYKPAGGAGGSYITLGEGQSASLFLRLGLYIGEESGGSPGGSPTEPPPEYEISTSSSGHHFYFQPSDRERILRDDEEIIAMIMSMIQTGMIQ